MKIPNLLSDITHLPSKILFALLLSGGISHAQQSPTTLQNGSALIEKNREAGLKAFFDAKFGVFIHFGLYSVPEGEWKDNKGLGEWFQIETTMPLAEYAKFAKQFNPTKFNARTWVKNIKNAGLKYVVMTTKHHDGFAMYNTKLSDYNVIKQTPWAHDPLKDLAAACKEAGIMLCLYYSLPDWHSTDFPAALSQRKFHGNPNPNADVEKYVAYMKGQLREVLTQYGPIGAFWFDDGGAFEGLDYAQRAKIIHAQEIVDLVHQLQPGCAIDDRLGFGSDYDTPEQRIPTGFPTKPFETCMSLNRHWGFNKNDHDWKSPKTVIQNLATVASKGGNYLIGVGAMGNGTFPPPEAETILDEVGKWLKVNGDSIYGTTASPVKTWLSWGCMTQKSNNLYLHVFVQPANQLLVPIQNGVKRAYLLADPSRAPLKVSSSDRGAMVTLPARAADPLDTVVVLELDGQPKVAAVSLNLAENKPVEVSSIWPEKGDKSQITDGKEETFWAAEESARTASITVDLQKECKVSAVMLNDAPYARTQAFDLEAKINGQWKKVVEGTTIGAAMGIPFPAVKAQLFRLNIRQASDTPTLSEFQLFE